MEILNYKYFLKIFSWLASSIETINNFDKIRARIILY